MGKDNAKLYIFFLIPKVFGEKNVTVVFVDAHNCFGVTGNAVFSFLFIRMTGDALCYKNGGWAVKVLFLVWTDENGK